MKKKPVNMKFFRTFHLVFAMLMLVTLAFAWVHTISGKWYEHDVERIALSNDVLQGYKKLSRLTLRELAAMSESVLPGDAGALSERGPGAAALREAISDLRQDIAEEDSFLGSGDVSEELEQVLVIERLVEGINRTSELIEQALNEGNTVNALSEWEALQNSGFAQYLNTFINTAIADRIVESQSVDGEVPGLIRYVAELAPALMTALVLIAFFFIIVFSRRLTQSVSALYEGALAFRRGDLSHRIPRLSDREFQRMGGAFNAMVHQLSEQQELLRNTKVQLETMVDERPLQLQETSRILATAEVNRRKLLANISHEFRTPLTVIRGEAEIALRGSNKTKADHRESFRRIVDQAENATRLVDDLLFIARADAGEPRLKLSSVGIVGMIDSVCQAFSSRAKNKGVKIEQGYMPSGTVVQGDPGRLRQVLVILLENALRYSNPGGRVEVQVLEANGNVEIVFQDEGIGLTEEESKLAFERFYRAPMAIEKASGTGLGLPVAKAIVKAHNGVISLKGKPGEGATATVVLPIGSEFGIVT